MGACGPSCWAMPTCATCGLRKAPMGRDAGTRNDLCGVDCPGWRDEPRSGHLWPGEPPMVTDAAAPEGAR